MPIINPINTGPNGFLGEELNSIAGAFGGQPISNLTFPSRYDYVKRFVNVPQDLYNGNNGVTSLDDPTYLGFSLLFVPNSPLFNGAENGSTEPPISSNYTSPEDSISSLESSNSEYSGESAVGYLEKIGEIKRAQYLRAFIQGIQEINRTRPYYFQSIEGLSEAWNKATDVSLDPYIGSAENEGITIGCLEAIDLKISALFSLYKLAVLDTKYRRYVLPKNLLRFDVIIYVQEIRQFKTVNNIAKNLYSNQGGGKLPSTDFVNSNTSQISFKFGECIWDATASGAVFDSVSNSEMTVASTNIKFSYSTLWFDSQFSGYNSSLDESKNQMIVGQLTSGIDPKEIISTQSNGLVQVAQQRSRSFSQSLLLGNVFGLRNQALGTINNPQGLANALNGAALNALTEINSPGIPQKIGDKIMPPGRLPTNNDGTPPKTFNSQRLFNPIPPGPPLDSTNIFE